MRKSAVLPATLTLSGAEAEHNALYVCCAIKVYPDKFDENGAVVLNHMIQARAGFTRPEAFKVVAEVLKTGLVRLEKHDSKRLVVVEELFKPFRDRMIDKIGQVQSEVVTFNWHLHRPRSLSESEKKDYTKHVKKGRIWDVKGGLPDRLAGEVMLHFEGLGAGEKQVRNPFDAEKRDFAAAMTEALQAFSLSMAGKDFILVVTKYGETLRPAMKIIERDCKIIIDF